MGISKKINRRDILKAGAILSGIAIVPRRVLGGKGFTAPSDQITLGFIGCGKQANGALRTNFLASKAQIVGASDVYRAKRNTLSRRESTSTTATNTGRASTIRVRRAKTFGICSPGPTSTRW